MQFNDTTDRTGIIQDCEDICGLGATGITSNTALFQQFARWANDWNKKGTHYALVAFDGHDVDDPGYTTYPTGTFTGSATARDYNLDSSYKMLKIKLVNVTYDGTHYYPATPIDSRQLISSDLAVKDPNIDSYFSRTSPQYDLFANGFKLYPNFTAAEVTAGAKVYVEFFRAPRDFATSGTNTYEPGIDLQFHRLVSLGASYEYARIYKPELVNQLRLDIWGNGGNIKGLFKELVDWYSSKQPARRHISYLRQNNR